MKSETGKRWKMLKLSLRSEGMISLALMAGGLEGGGGGGVGKSDWSCFAVSRCNFPFRDFSDNLGGRCGVCSGVCCLVSNCVKGDNGTPDS